MKKASHCPKQLLNCATRERNCKYFKGVNKESEAKDKSVRCILIIRIIVTYVVILYIKDFGKKTTNHGEIAQF